jgi:hypothetical protein
VAERRGAILPSFAFRFWSALTVWFLSYRRPTLKLQRSLKSQRSLTNADCVSRLLSPCCSEKIGVHWKIEFVAAPVVDDGVTVG